MKPNDFPLMLAQHADAAFDRDGWIFELKLDGQRCLAMRDGAADCVHLYAREGREISHKYPEVTEELGALACKRFVIDGELVAFDKDGRPDLGQLQTRLHSAALAKQVRIQFCAFDLLVCHEVDVRSVPLLTRKEMLALVLDGHRDKAVCVVPHVEREGVGFFNVVLAQKLEGLIAKRGAAHYQSGKRSPDWIKVKVDQVDNFLVGGWTDPEGSRLNFGALVIGQRNAKGDLVYVGKVGSGFKEEELRAIFKRLTKRASSPFKGPAPKANWCEPLLTVAVRFNEITADKRLRHPRLEAIISCPCGVMKFGDCAGECGSQKLSCANSPKE